MVGAWRDLNNNLYDGALITITEDAWSVQQPVDTAYGFEWDVEPTILKLSDAATDLTVTLGTSSTLSIFDDYHGNTHVVTRGNK